MYNTDIATHPCRYAPGRVRVSVINPGVGVIGIVTKAHITPGPASFVAGALRLR